MASIVHLSPSPLAGMLCHICAPTCWQPPGIRAGALKESSVSNVSIQPRAHISLFSLSSPFWQEYSAPAVLASPGLMQIRVCLIKGFIRLLFVYDVAY